MISHQELSAQQVASYIMDYEDHFTSHEYRNLFWTSFESFINKEDPSPECYYQKNHSNLFADNSDSGEDHEISLYNNLNQPELDLENSIDNEVIGHESENLADHENYLGDKNPIEDDEVTISTQEKGKLFAKANQVSDYQLQGKDLENWCVWDFISRAEKIRIRQACRRKDFSENVDNNMIVNQSDDDDNELVNGENTARSSNLAEISTPNASGGHQKLIVHFQSEHIEATTHCSSIRSLDKKFIPVPIGPSLPRCDQEEVKARYCRLMLILFKPWRHANDLRLLGQSWELAFSEFLEQLECSSDFKTKMKNMQLLHECRDSGRDHFSDHQKKGHRGRYPASEEITNASVREENDDFGPVNPEVILDHLQSISDCNSRRIARSKEIVSDCLLSAEKSGMFDTTVEQFYDLNKNTVENSGNKLNEIDFVEKVDDCNLHLEEQWKAEYELRCDQWKRKASTTHISENSITSSSLNVGETNSSAVNDGSALRNALQSQNVIDLEPSIQQLGNLNIPTTIDEPVLVIDEMIKEFTLNTEQARAFQIICEHSLKKQSSPLRMYLGGAGGTGKSRVIKALKEFFIRRGQSRRFRLASYTGVAAKNISGMTVHAALSINQRNKSGSQSKTHRDLVAMWEGVDFFFIDEISMIGCTMLYKISEALIDSKSIDAPFGGINLIVAGDFAQLPPVGETRLYANIDTSKNRSASTRNQETVFGKLLWLSK